MNNADSDIINIKLLLRQTWSYKANANQFKKVTKPTASQISHQAIHPALIRSMKEDTGLVGFATTISGNSKFESDFIKVSQDRFVRHGWEYLQSLRIDARDGQIQPALFSLIDRIGLALDMDVRVEQQERMTVGGILAHGEYDIHGETDISVYNGVACLLVMQVKTELTYPNHRWYRRCRATQILVPMYHSNAPTFLVTNKKFKIFYENDVRDSIYTFPTDQSENRDFRKTLGHAVMGDDFIKAVIICLRRTPTGEVATPVYVNQENVPMDTSNVSSNTAGEKKEPAKKTVQPSFKYKNSMGETETVDIRLYDKAEVAAFLDNVD